MDLEGRITLAEVAGASGDLDIAFQLLQKIMETGEANQSQLKWRVQGDLGVVALKLGEIETALAALEQAVQQKPEMVDLQAVLVGRLHQS